MQDENRIHTDVVMKMIWRRLLEDLSRDLGPERADFEEAKGYLALNDIPKFRDCIGKIRLPFWSTASHFKAVYQLKGFTDRYIFASDKLSPEELRSVTWVKYLETQRRIQLPIDWDPLFFSGLLEEWRGIASAILGPYDPDEHLQYCRFAKNACVGHPASRKRLDHKVKGPITGSCFHLQFLRRALDEDPHLTAALAGARWKQSTYLQLQLVPKSYKSLRAIMPDTLAGSFYSAGLGRVIQNRLAAHGLDIDRLQERHRRLARLASADLVGGRRRLATLDLSSASDSITVDLLYRILPKKWYDIVTAGRIARYQFNGTEYDLQSACTMGLGHTFPLETLVFYVLVRGIMNRYAPGKHGLVSVYGDDIILPTWAVKPVVSVFKRLHLLVNDDKSFWGLCDFRESCGGDFFRGISVRPARPEQQGCRLGRRKFVAFLYKVANVLILRWGADNIYRTLQTICQIISLVDGFVLSVPPDFPDESGLKVEPGSYGTEVPTTVNWGTPVVRFWRATPHVSPPLSEEAFLWEWLRENATRSFQEPTWRPLNGYRRIGDITRLDGQPKVALRKRRRGRRVQLVAYVVDPGEPSWATTPHTTIVPHGFTGGIR